MDHNKKKIQSAALQYSKWLSRFICWVWALYRFAVLIVSAIQPSVAESIAATISGMDTIMLVNEGTYLVNSLGEKWIYSDRFVLTWLKGGGFKRIISSALNHNSDDDDGDDEVVEDEEEYEEENEE